MSFGLQPLSPSDGATGMSSGGGTCTVLGEDISSKKGSLHSTNLYKYICRSSTNQNHYDSFERIQNWFEFINAKIDFEYCRMYFFCDQIKIQFFWKTQILQKKKRKIDSNQIKWNYSNVFKTLKMFIKFVHVHEKFTRTWTNMNHPFKSAALDNAAFVPHLKRLLIILCIDLQAFIKACIYARKAIPFNFEPINSLTIGKRQNVHAQLFSVTVIPLAQYDGCLILDFGRIFSSEKWMRVLAIKE